MLTPAQGYLMFFNNRGLTVSPLVSLSNPIHFFSINSFLLKYPSCPHPTVILRKILDCGHSLSKFRMSFSHQSRIEWSVSPRCESFRLLLTTQKDSNVTFNKSLLSKSEDLDLVNKLTIVLQFSLWSRSELVLSH